MSMRYSEGFVDSRNSLISHFEVAFDSAFWKWTRTWETRIDTGNPISNIVSAMDDDGYDIRRWNNHPQDQRETTLIHFIIYLSLALLPSSILHKECHHSRVAISRVGALVDEDFSGLYELERDMNSSLPLSCSYLFYPGRRCPCEGIVDSK